MKVHRFFNFVLFSNLFIGIVALLMCYLTIRVFRLDLNPGFYGLVFFATLCSYCLHWYLTPDIAPASVRVVWTLQNKRMLLWIFLVSLLGLLFAMLLNLGLLGYLLPAAILAFVYTSPKIPFRPFIFLRGMMMAKTVYLSLTWTYVTAMLPLLAAHTAITQEHWVFVLNRFLFIHIVSMVFDFRDKEIDKGPINITKYLTEKQFYHVIISLTILFLMSLVYVYEKMSSPVLIFSVGIPFILLLITRRMYHTNKSDYVYYGFLDGVLMLPTLLYCLLVL